MVGEIFLILFVYAAVITIYVYMMSFFFVNTGTGTMALNSLSFFLGKLLFLFFNAEMFTLHIIVGGII